MPARRSEHPPADELRPGDVLLFHGHGALSWAIRRFDESDVDHAAIVLDPETAAMATVSGLQRVPIGPEIDANAFTYVCRTARDVNTEPVAATARSLMDLHDLSVHEHILLLGMLGMTRRLPIREPMLRALLRRLLDLAAEMAETLALSGRQLMAASEFVYRSCEQAGDPNLALDILLPSEKPSAAKRMARGELGDSVLMEWASEGPEAEPVRCSSRSLLSDLRTLEHRAEQELTPLIQDFARVDSPHDPLGRRNADPMCASETVTDDELRASAVRFRDQIVRLAMVSHPSIGGAPWPEHPWGTFRAVTSFVTPGGLRYSPSLRPVATIRSRPWLVPRFTSRDLPTV